jgi:hypothetical protein
MDIILKKDCNGKPKYYCPHCNTLLTSTLRSTACRKCGKPVDWKKIPK